MAKDAWYDLSGYDSSMKDVFGAFGSEVFRPLVTLLLPGALSISSWLVFLMERNANLLKLAKDNRSESIAVIVAIALFMGLLCEEIGSHIEGEFDEKRNATTGVHTSNWHAYWRIAYKVEPIGHHYLHNPTAAKV